MIASLSPSREDSGWVASVLPAPLWVPAQGGSRPRPGYCSTEKKSAIPLSVTGVTKKAWVGMFTGDGWKDKRKERIPMFKCSLNQHGRRKEGLKSSSCNALGKKWLMVLPVTHQLLGGEGGEYKKNNAWRAGLKDLIWMQISEIIACFPDVFFPGSVP